MFPEDDERIKEDAVQAQVRRRREIDDLIWLMDHAQGRRIVLRLLERAGVNRSSFSVDMAAMAFAEGRRDMGLFITSEILEAAPEGYFTALEEFAGATKQ